MIPEDINKLSEKEKEARIWHRIRNFREVCIECGETLTVQEKLLGDCYCLACWPLTERNEELDG